MGVATVTEKDSSRPDLERQYKWSRLALSDEEIQGELRSLGLSEDEMQRELLLYRVCVLEPMWVTAAVRLLQLRAAEELVDLTWTEAFQVFFDLLSRELRTARKLSRQFGKKDWRIPWATTTLRKVVRRAFKAYQGWLEEGRNALTRDILEAYRRKVDRYWGDEAGMQRHSTEHRRQKARTLKKQLDSNPDMAELRRRIRIPHEGFQDVDQATRWVYDRCPPHSFGDANGLYGKPYGPEDLEYSRSLHLYNPAIVRVPVLGEATRRLRRKYELHWHWDFVLCFCLLRGQLEPLPRKIFGRERPKAERDGYLLDLLQRHSYRRTQIIYNCGLSEEEFQRIEEAHPGASDGKLEWLCYQLGAEKGSLREDEITYYNLRKIKWRWGASDTAL